MFVEKIGKIIFIIKAEFCGDFLDRFDRVAKHDFSRIDFFIHQILQTTNAEIPFENAV